MRYTIEYFRELTAFQFEYSIRLDILVLSMQSKNNAHVCVQWKTSQFSSLYCNLFVELT